MNETNIYKDKGKTKWYYIGTIDVICPKCSKKAVLKTPNQSQDEPELICSHCYYSMSGYVYSANSNIQKIVCEKCKTVFDLQSKDLIITVKKTNCKCPECDYINQVNVEFDLSKNGNMWNYGSKDQYYGLDFWYQTNFKNNCFWAYNLEHLTRIMH